MPFKPLKIVDPRTGKERIVSPEEQQMLLAKGILLDVPLEPTDSSTPTTKPNTPEESNG